MCVAIIGGMTRLEQHYRDEAERLGVTLKVFPTAEHRMENKLRCVDAVIIFTGKVSHRARNEAVSAAKSMGIPVHMRHSCGVCTLRQCLGCIAPEEECERRKDHVVTGTAVRR
ncbi:DUF2325 domain-containing protein [Geobacter sp. DSM 9736]|uniref:DUF2325 domain-containing protein n=1 Tax=Geobacter sp. DSM 9736 TaxID=1277350 RepID=UPI000B50A976|nr:DUF2325 domain-containing protein [Geobacter sp. DSM 9736]SNB44760.1 hypothetical protein SAMN06269301_0147 [Geobacter sp. DSM 9736]